MAADAVGVERRGRPHVVWLPQWVAAAAATGEDEEEEVARRRWFELLRESPCERMGQRVAEVGTGYGKASDGRRPGGQDPCCGCGLHQGPSGGYTRGVFRCLFSSKKFYKIDTVAILFVFNKNCPIMD